LTFGPTLVCPVRVLYSEFYYYCATMGLVADTPSAFVGQLALEPDIQIKQGGRGKLKKYVQGLGFIREYRKQLKANSQRVLQCDS
jgi:hypothetical protein